MKALDRNVSIDTSDMDVIVAGNEIAFKGTVDPWCQKNLAGKIVWKALGINNVYNELNVEYKGIALPAGLI